VKPITATEVKESWETPEWRQAEKKGMEIWDRVMDAFLTTILNTIKEGSMNVGFDNFVPWWRVVAILQPNSSAAARYREKAENEGRLVNISAGRKRRSIIVTDTNQAIISSVAPETLLGRLEAKRIEELPNPKLCWGA